MYAYVYTHIYVSTYLSIYLPTYPATDLQARPRRALNSARWDPGNFCHKLPSRRLPQLFLGSGRRPEPGLGVARASQAAALRKLNKS